MFELLLLLCDLGIVVFLVVVDCGMTHIPVFKQGRVLSVVQTRGQFPSFDDEFEFFIAEVLGVDFWQVGEVFSKGEGS